MHTPETKRVLEKLLGTMKKYTIRIHFKNGNKIEVQTNESPRTVFNSDLRECVFENHYNDAPFLFRMSEIEGYSSEVNLEKAEP